VNPSTFRAFVTLGFTKSKAKEICKDLSSVVARCSYAIYLAHNSPVWPHNEDLVLSNRSNGKPKPEPSSEGKQLQRDPRAALDVLRKNGIKILYHFTDESNVQSIRAHGLMSASTLLTKSISSVMNSDEASRQLDIKAGLENYVRLSFCAKNPMMYVSLNEGRISKPVMLNQT
jgi:hypothetical protein